MTTEEPIKTSTPPHCYHTTNLQLHTTGKANSIDNQSLTPKNTKITGNKPAKPKMNNKPNMTTKPKYNSTK